MAARNSDYWKRRMATLGDEQFRRSAAYYSDVQEQYRRALNDLQQDIERWYWRLADNNEISYAGARKLLKKNELEEFRWTVEEYIKAGKENALDQRWMKALENASAKYHISRLEAMKLQMQQHAELLATEFEGGMTEFLQKSYGEQFYRTAYEIAKGTGIGSNLTQLDTRKIDKILKTPWARDGANFSDRIWSNKEKLVNNLHTELTQMIIRGEDPKKAIERLAKAMNVSKNQAGNLVMTESAAISSAAQRDCFQELDVEEFEVVETFDDRTCEICQAMNGKHFPMSDYEVGVTVPPFHPRCRGYTCPYFDDEFSGGERAARDPETGKTVYVDSKMTYSEWKKTFVDNEEQMTLESLAKAAGSGKIELTDDEQLAMNRYISSESYPLNDKLRRGEKLTDEEQALIDHLDAALDKMPEYEGIVYRSMSEFGIDDVDDFIRSYQVGQKVVFPSYISSSETVYDKSFPIQYKIRSKHGKDVRNYNEAEKEILFKRNSSFRVLNRREYEGFYFIELEEE